MSRVAPTLAAFVKMHTAPGYAPIRAELRALLAVARAARKLRERVADVAREARNTHQGELDGDRIGRLIENAVEDADRSLARLDRLAGGR